jgi:hypothetical protein
MVGGANPEGAVGKDRDLPRKIQLTGNQPSGHDDSRGMPLRAVK